MTKAVVPGMISRGYGRIIYLGAVLSERPQEGVEGLLHAALDQTADSSRALPRRSTADWPWADASRTGVIAMHIIDLTYIEAGIHEELVAYVAARQTVYAYGPRPKHLTAFGISGHWG